VKFSANRSPLYHLVYIEDVLRYVDAPNVYVKPLFGVI